MAGVLETLEHISREIGWSHAKIAETIDRRSLSKEYITSVIQKLRMSADKLEELLK